MKWGVFRIVLPFILAVLLLLVLTSCSGGGESSDVVNPAPDFALEDLDGNQVVLSDLRGQKVFLNFWRIGCPYCLKELPEIEKVHRMRDEGNFVILTINPSDPPEKIRAFMRENGYTFPVLLDSRAKVARSYGIRGVPTNIVVGESGEILHTKLGVVTEMQLKAYLGLD